MLIYETSHYKKKPIIVSVVATTQKGGLFLYVIKN